MLKELIETTKDRLQINNHSGIFGGACYKQNFLGILPGLEIDQEIKPVGSKIIFQPGVTCVLFGSQVYKAFYIFKFFFVYRYYLHVSNLPFLIFALSWRVHIPFHLYPSCYIFCLLLDFFVRCYLQILSAQHEALGNKPHKLCSYSSDPRTEVHCFKLNFNILKLVNCQTSQCLPNVCSD